VRDLQLYLWKAKSKRFVKTIGSNAYAILHRISVIRICVHDQRLISRKHFRENQPDHYTITTSVI